MNLYNVIKFHKWFKNEILWNQLNLNIMNDCCIQMSLKLISIPGCDSKSWTISVWPLFVAKIKGVLSNIWVQFHKWFKIKIQWNNEI